MELIILKENLKEAMAAAERFSGGDANLPILKNVLLEANDGQIKVVATNLEMALEHILPGKVIAPGKTTVPGGLLSSLLSGLKNDRLNLELHGQTMTLKTDNYEAKIQTAPADDFPIIPRLKTETPFLELKAELLKGALEQVTVAAQFSEIRPELSSVYWLFESEQLKLVTTDSFRLAEKVIPHSQYENSTQEPQNFLLPLKTAQELARLLREGETVKIYKDEFQVLFQGPRWQLISRLNEGTFPNYEAIIPKEFKSEMIIDKGELLEALKLTSIFGSLLNEVTLTILENQKVVELSSQDQSLGENQFRLAAKIKTAGLPGLTFNWRYLNDGLKALSGKEIFLALSEENKPACLKSPQDNSYFYILMPILK